MALRAQLAWLDPERIVARLDAMVDELPDGEAMSTIVFACALTHRTGGGGATDAPP